MAAVPQRLPGHSARHGERCMYVQYCVTKREEIRKLGGSMTQGGKEDINTSLGLKLVKRETKAEGPPP